jgi:hypothetical protein
MWYWTILFHLFCQLDLDPESPLGRLQDHKSAQTTLIICKTERNQNLDRIVVTVGTTQFARDTIFCMFHIQNNWELDMCTIPHAYHTSNKSENSQNQRSFPIMYETPPISYNSCIKHRKFAICTIQGETGNCNQKKRDCKRDSELIFSKSFT